MKIRSIRELAAVARDRRKKLGWSQAHTATQAGVGRDWLIGFEKAKATVELGMVLRLLRVLGLAIHLDDDATDPIPAHTTGKDNAPARKEEE